MEGHDGKTTIGLAAYPSDVKVDPARLFCDSLVQVAFTGDEGLIDYTFGQTMRNRAGTLLKIEAQTSDEAGVTTVLTDGRGNRYRHVLTYSPETGVFCVQVQYENASEETRSLEMLETLSLSGIMALSAPESTRGLTLHRMTSAWSRECRLQSDTFSNLGLDMSWARYGVRVEKWGEAGSMPNRGHFPFAAIEDARAGVFWGVLSEASFSWQMEVYQEKESCSLSCGMGDYAFAHWRKNIPAGATFNDAKGIFYGQARGSQCRMQRVCKGTGAALIGACRRGGDARSVQRILHDVGMSVRRECPRHSQGDPTARSQVFRHRLRLVQT